MVGDSEQGEGRYNKRDGRRHLRRRRRPSRHRPSALELHGTHVVRDNNEQYDQVQLLRLLGLDPRDLPAGISPPEASPLTASRRKRPPAQMERPPASDTPGTDDDSPEDGSGLLDGSGFGHNSSDATHPTRGAGAPLVRAEEALIVLIVLLLWGAAIALFFNRWGKIRMLEPYQPKFQQPHRASCPMLELAGPQVSDSHRTFSKFNLNNCSGNEAVYSSLLGRNSMAGLSNCGVGSSRPRQNSVFAGSSMLVTGSLHQTLPRKAKSAMDLQMLVMQSEADECEEERTLLRSCRPSPPQPTRVRKGSILPPVPPVLTPLPPPPVLTPLMLPPLPPDLPPSPPPVANNTSSPQILPPATHALLRVTNV